MVEKLRTTLHERVWPCHQHKKNGRNRVEVAECFSAGCFPLRSPLFNEDNAKKTAAEAAETTITGGET